MINPLRNWSIHRSPNRRGGKLSANDVRGASSDLSKSTNVTARDIRCAGSLASWGCPAVLCGVTFDAKPALTGTWGEPAEVDWTRIANGLTLALPRMIRTLLNFTGN